MPRTPELNTGRSRGQGGKGALARKRTVAKTGMALSMGSLVATGMMRGPRARALHIWSGLALVGFSFWHHALYHPQNRE
jgi:hypothetical protein